MKFGFSGFRRALLAIAAGAVAVPAFAPVGGFPLAFVSLAVLAGLLDRAGSKRAGFGLGFAWGLGAFGAGISWLYVALERYGGMYPPLAAFAIFLFCAFLSLYPALAGAFYVRFRHGGPIRRAGLFAALWVLAEWLRGTLFTGFPWLAIGYSQTPPSPLAAYFPLVGVYGVGGAVAFASAIVALGCVGQHERRVLARNVACSAAVILAAWPLSWFSWTEADGPPLSVSLIQTNIEQSFKWDRAYFFETLAINIDLVKRARGELVVLPEVALPAMLDTLPEDYLYTLAAPVSERGGALVAGVFTRDGEQIHNAAVSLGEDSGQKYAKSHLVPFGEYSPPFFDWFYQLVDIPMSRQSPGAADQPPLRLLGRQIAVNICYEDIFGTELRASLPQAGLMLNLSNLAWYGDSLAQPQHLQIARARALETGRPMLRSTNTGMTALVLPDGSVPSVQPAFTSGVLEVEVPAYRGLTPYARWGDLPALVAALLALVAVVWTGRSFVKD